MGNCFSTDRVSTSMEEVPPLNGISAHSFVMGNPIATNPNSTPNLVGVNIENPPFPGKLLFDCIMSQFLLSNCVQVHCGPMALHCLLLLSRILRIQQPRFSWPSMIMMLALMKTWVSRKASIWKSSMTHRVTGGWLAVKQRNRKATFHQIMLPNSNPLKLNRKIFLFYLKNDSLHFDVDDID